MRSIWIFATLVACAIAASVSQRSSNIADGKIRYDNYQVFRISVKKELQGAITELFKTKSSKYNVWKEYDEASKDVDVMVNPQEIPNFLEFLNANNLESRLMINNVQELMEEEVNPLLDRAASDEFGWKRYYELHEINQWLDHILATYPNVTEGFVIGKSYEQRDIRGIKISYKAGNPGIFIESNIHAREWITSATTTWFINELLTSKQKVVRDLAENYDWYIIPVLNVDGFVYSHEQDRLWRKTRQPVEDSPCMGTDANRNFDSHWLENGGASSRPCDETYGGPKPFSEPEALALANFVASVKDKIKIYLSFHSYSQVIMSPFGHSAAEFPENYDDMQAVGKSFSDAIGSLAYGTQYNYGSVASVMYIATGATIDWVYNNLGIKLAYTIEFRDTGRYGFVLPPVQIVPNSEELLAGMIALVDNAKKFNYL